MNKDPVKPHTRLFTTKPFAAKDEEGRPQRRPSSQLDDGNAALHAHDALDLGEQRDRTSIHARGNLGAHGLAIRLLDKELDTVAARVGGEHRRQARHVGLAKTRAWNHDLEDLGAVGLLVELQRQDLLGVSRRAHGRVP